MLMVGSSMMIDDHFDNELSEELSIDMGTLLDMTEEKESDRLQTSLEDSSLKNSSQEDSAVEDGNHSNLQFQSGYQLDFLGPVTSYSSYDLEASDDQKGRSGDYHSNLQHTERTCSLVHTCSASPDDWFSPTSGTCCPERFGISQFETPGCSTGSSFSEGDGNHVFNDRDNMDFYVLDGATRIQFGHMGSQIDSKFVDASHSHFMENLDVNYEPRGGMRGNRLVSLGVLENGVYSFSDVSFRDADVASNNVASADSTACPSSEVIRDVDDQFSTMQYYMNTDNTFVEDLSSFNCQSVPSNEETTTKKSVPGEFSTESACSSSRMAINASNGSLSELSLIDGSDVNGQSFRCEDSNYFSPIYENSLSNIGNRIFDGKASAQSFGYSHSHFSSKKQSGCVKDEGNGELIAFGSTINGSVELVDEVVSRHSSYHDGGNFVECSNQFPTGVAPSFSSQKNAIHAQEEKAGLIIESKRAGLCQQIINGSVTRSLIDDGDLNLQFNSSSQYFPGAQASVPNEKQLSCFKGKKEVELIKLRSMVSNIPKVSPESTYSSISLVDDDPDICILEDMSQPACSNQSVVLGKSFNMSQASCLNAFGKPAFTQYHSSDTLNYTGVPQIGFGGLRLRGCNERLFQAALQDLSQHKSEASPPDGVLAVPLLRHQRIALSWMIQKERSSMQCSGGILADDQGLGKTISTIALILKERPPTCKAENVSKCKLETLNLDDDDDDNGDGAFEHDRIKKESDYFPEGVKEESDYSPVTSDGNSVKNLSSLGHGRGRPAAGTLVVCPTSVLRQWAEELRNKVTNKGSLSVLVYHGSNRTKDPSELAKYDVVITTYSIVSMEVPKQPPVDKEDDDEKIKAESDDVSPMCWSGKKRKSTPNSDKKGKKCKKGVDDMLLEIAAGPLAKVGWFRVVLDEAQSIKNHRTQVARACWGLRAKRRWCLSGTPIQNAIDDLYSYFRFLRYEPFDVYKSFCARIKVPISKSPAEGYKKLQVVLKTIMLRRTKGTLLDGEPIINLPPKVIELQQVDFTKEERDFYNQLEIDSRDQFKEYAAAGTVKQNYVNILFMLLRLRQACDHPLLVKGFNSNSSWRSSVEMAKKLPREKQICLLKCLEASLAICGICSDPPEDAVVSVCGHVFCNQCIHEHLTGDDSLCPTTNCKVQLSVSSVFSKATLKNSLSQQNGQDSFADCSGPDVVEAPEHCSDSISSSKIKAALEVLQSLAKAREPELTDSCLQNSFGDSTCVPEDSYNLHSGDSLNNIPDEKRLVAEKDLKDSIKVVGEKAIVFSQWTKMLDLLEACLKGSSIQYRRLDGTMSVVSRDKAVKDFNTLPEVSVMIMSLKAASLGLNMVAACHVLLLDLWWNPTTEDQAIDRAHRIGQTRPVTVLRLTVKNTVEDRILALQQKKREMVASAFGEDETGGQQTRLTVDDLNYLFMV
ncbi:helicase-like transcription factor CHR28 isoform X2 [Mangifera indica]|uniref:helicase-like transcription factor CHR28 isoform X2 n=1 Tax=Mangifera indica TaxID=29780 RepID=UPI001CFB9250|nr:helicase-like transcription factor CHR28 isoform X2 [Mangifera indica]